MTSTLRRPGPLTRFRRSLDRRDRRSLAGMAGVIIGLHLLGFGVLFGLVIPHHFRLGGDHPVFDVGVGILAYTFGLRHAFDADHIAAVDTTTRKLIADNNAKKPLSVGFWFSLGHSTIVFMLAFLLTAGVKAMAGQLEAGDSTLHSTTAVVGASVSGVFLWILGILNLVVLFGIVRVFREMRAGRYDEQQLEEQLNKRGLMNRLLGITGVAATKGNLPPLAILSLPVLFAAGMCLMDTIDGVFMNLAYGWAFAQPVRKVFYNITVTAISVAVALIIGTIELAGAVAEQAGITSGPVSAIADIPLDYAGYAIVGLFAVAWAVALLVWRIARVEERWSDP